MCCNLFTLEHNNLCHELQTMYPNLDNTTLFARVQAILALYVRRIITEDYIPIIGNFYKSNYLFKCFMT